VVEDEATDEEATFGPLKGKNGEEILKVRPWEGIRDLFKRKHVCQ